MKLVAPDYYTQFKCIAGQCRHSCCIGWEIDIDKDTLGYYNTIEGNLGKKLKDNISVEGDTAHFVLGKDERCPFLNQDGLCEIICKLGENALCQICDDHPRFRNFYSDRTEIGLGLCCEAAAKLILSQKDKTRLVTLEEDGEELLYPEEEELLGVRQQIFDMLQNRTESLDKRVEDMLDFCDISLPKKTHSQWADIYMSLERLDPVRDIMFEELKNTADRKLHLPQTQETETAFEQLLCYFIYRHLTDSLDDDRLWQRVAFAAQSYYTIRSLCGVHYNTKGRLTIDDMAEISRIYSSEIEYSEDNMEILLDIFS